MPRSKSTSRSIRSRQHCRKLRPSAAATTCRTAGRRSAAARGQGGHLGVGDRPHRDLGDRQRPPGQVGQHGVQLGPGRPVAPGQHQQQRQPGQPASHVRGQPQAGPVGAVRVVHRDQRRPVRAGPLDQPQHGLEHAQPLELRRGHRGRHARLAETAAELRREPVQLDRPAGRRGRAARRSRPGPGPAPATPRTASRRRRPCRRRPRSGRRPARPGAPVRRAGWSCRSRLAGEHHDLPGTVGGGPPRRGQAAHLGAAPEQARPGGGAGAGVQSGVRGPGRR